MIPSRLLLNERNTMKNEIQPIEKQLSDWCAETFATCFPDADLSGIHLGVNASRNEQFGDYQCDAAMKLAKALKSNPRAIGQTFVDNATLPDLVEKIEIAGPGFINIYLKNEGLAVQLTAMLGDDNLGLPNIEKNQTVIIDYSSPNVAKPMHVGHLRSAVIGDTLLRLLRFLGDDVTSDTHLGDWGLQMGHLVTELYDEQPDLIYFDEAFTGPYPDEPPVTIEDLGRLYPAASNKAKAKTCFAIVGKPEPGSRSDASR